MDINVSSHVLDTATGLPAADIRLQMFYYTGSNLIDEGNFSIDNNSNEHWSLVGESTTNQDGRAKVFLPMCEDTSTLKGIYKMIFYTQPYFQRTATPSFYPQVDLSVTISYHIIST